MQVQGYLDSHPAATNTSSHKKAPRRRGVMERGDVVKLVSHGRDQFANAHARLVQSEPRFFKIKSEQAGDACVVISFAVMHQVDQPLGDRKLYYSALQVDALDVAADV